MNHSPEVVERFSYIKEGCKINPDDLKVLSRHRDRAYLNNFISASENNRVIP